ncbi:MAG TPA: DUF177 domain-containing protein, partial [Acidimicrobiia bacterium]
FNCSHSIDRRTIETMSDGLVVDVSDLVGHPDAVHRFVGGRRISLRLGDVVVDGPMAVSGEVKGTVDGVIAEFTATAPAQLSCVRCLTTWVGEVTATGSQHFSKVADEDGYAIVDRHVDVSGPATDEVALALPSAPLCTPDCKGLCPICGTDLNSDPCDGHGEESDSPFAALRDLFDS